MPKPVPVFATLVICFIRFIIALIFIRSKSKKIDSTRGTLSVALIITIKEERRTKLFQ